MVRPVTVLTSKLRIDYNPNGFLDIVNGLYGRLLSVGEIK